MKIDGNAPNGGVRPLGNQPETSKVKPGSAGEAGSASHGDTVTLSSQAQFVGKTLQAAENSPAVRQDKVEQAKQKLANGELSDPTQLANRMIDHLLEG